VSEAAASWPPTGRLLAAQVVAQLRVFLRIPVALFFTIALPLIIVVLFNLTFGGADATVETETGDWSIQQFYVAALAAFEVVSATFTNLANMIPDRRQDGVMKRWRGTPLPPWTYLCGFVGAGLIIAVAGFALIVGVGFAVYDLSIDLAKVPALIIAFIVGTLVFSALGVAVAGLIRSQEAAPAVTNAIILPMAFISNTFIAVDYSAMPDWLDTISRILPLRPFVESIQAPFNPTVDPPGLLPVNLAILIAWGVIGVVAAARTFKWEPIADIAHRASRRSRRQRRRSATEGQRRSATEEVVAT
jgi:ABC-2 type transport system permease protein